MKQVIEKHEKCKKKNCTVKSERKRTKESVKRRRGKRESIKVIE